MRCSGRTSTSAGWILVAVPFFFAVASPRVLGAPQAPSPTALPDSVEELEHRIDNLSSALNELRAEVKRSHQEAQELRQELDEIRAQLRLSPKLGSPEISPAHSSGAPARSSQSSPQSEDAQIAARLGTLEEKAELLESKVDDQYQTKVESSSKYRVKLSGIALLNIFDNRGTVDNIDLPNFAVAPGPLDSSRSVGATVRQSELRLEVFGPKLGNARTSADVNVDFFGGFPGTIGGITTGLVRLRTARMRLDWDRTSIVAGQDAPFFTPLSPTSLASLADPALSYAGNLWSWTPQVRVEHRVPVTEGSNFIIAAGILDPLTGESPLGQYVRLPQAGERSGQPAYAARLAWSGAAWKQPLSLGLGSYYARQDWGFGRKIEGWAATADWQVPLGRKLGLSGEFYRGRALGGLGAAEGRSVVFSGLLTDPATSVVGLNTAGGWSQLKFSPTEKLEFNGAFGEDVPNANDIARFTFSNSYTSFQVTRNQSGFVNVIYKARSNLLFSAEYRKLWTFETYETNRQADVINLSMGVLF